MCIQIISPVEDIDFNLLVPCPNLLLHAAQQKEDSWAADWAFLVKCFPQGRSGFA